MIGRLHGQIVEKRAPSLLLDVKGVAYEVEASMSTFFLLPGEGETVVLYTHLIVRDDSQALFGFSSRQERDLFRLLIKVNGVGPKLALIILSGMSVEQFCHCVHENDSASFIRLPGVGKKTAQRLLIEIRDRLPLLKQDNATTSSSRGQLINNKQEAVSAMVALGYKNSDAQRLIDRVFEAGVSSEVLIRRALQSTMQTANSSVES